MDDLAPPRVLARNVRPFCGRVTVMASPVDEVMEGEIIIPLEHDHDDGLERAVILAVDPSWDESPPQARAIAEQIPVGRVVYYEGQGRRIRDVVVLDIQQIVAYETDD